MNAWDHLPNAKHIDRILASVKANLLEWEQSWHQVGARARDQAWYQASDQARKQARDQGRIHAWIQALDQVCYYPKGVLLALVTYDDCAKYLNLPLDQLEMLYHLTDHPACILLQPAVLVLAKEKELA